MSIFIIAEIGINHNGSVDTCKALIDVAKESAKDLAKQLARDSTIDLAKDSAMHLAKDVAIDLTENSAKKMRKIQRMIQQII